jgi:P27 family predicted phage terminase small subunit
VARLRGDYKTNPGRENKQEPIPSAGLVAPPFKLNKRAQEVWNRLAPDLIRKKVLTPWDVDLFAEFCEAVVILRAKRRHSRSRPVPGQSSPMSEYRTAVGIVTTIGSRYGLTPADRAKLTVGGGDEQDGDDLLT